MRKLDMMIDSSKAQAAALPRSFVDRISIGFFFPTLLWKIKVVRQAWYLLERLPPFLVAAFSTEGLVTSAGRQLLVGKFRRFFISLVPGLSARLQKYYGLTGGCHGCGTSCRLLFQCPHWDDTSRLCTVYEDRPAICRLFPITPSDIRDRDLAASMGNESCGFRFKP